MPQENSTSNDFISFLYSVKYRMQITQWLSKYRLTTKSLKFMQQQLRQYQQVTQLLVTTAVQLI